MSPAHFFFGKLYLMRMRSAIFRDFRGKLISEANREVKVSIKATSKKPRCTAYEVASLTRSRRPSSFLVASGGRVRKTRNKARLKTRMRVPTLRLKELKVDLNKSPRSISLLLPIFSVCRYAENSKQYQNTHQKGNSLP